MVLDEDALEAMLHRGKQDGGDERQETVTTDQTEEYEVYERKELAEEAAAEAGPPVAQPEAALEQAPPQPSPRQPSRYIDERPAQGEPPQAPAPRHETGPSRPEASDDRHRGEAAGERPRQETSEDHSPDAGGFRPEPAGAPTRETRRPQVWPPMHAPESAQEGEPSTPEPGDAARAEAYATSEELPRREAPAAADTPQDGPRDGPPTHATNPGSTTHNPTGHAVPAATTPGDGCRLAVVQALFNKELTDMMAELAIGHAKKRGAEVTHHVTVPGVFDLPLTTQRMAQMDDVDAVVVIGCVVQGQTRHDELITQATATNLQQVTLATDVPVGFGVTGPGMTWEQAEARVVHGKHAVEAALAQWQALRTL